MNEPIVTVENLTKQYKGKAETAVSHISFTMQPGEIMALIGPNGAGKTT
ncbi:MAG: ATP-binding cassette domain-containing protein, partial [Anaerolineales bacterium]|nr:ATP-binding cassette domain-containing protein [Anaerolineales bacterium]